MLITTLFKFTDRHSLVVCGHMTKQEIASLKAEGWRIEQPNVNKNGIPVKKQIRRKKS
ncbi:hypothetical protein [Psychrobacillus sp. NPDC096389]|uniref:hypothetical protein n=1 Tax=Psychrobacillus sp. NPDC096389 TaxID=3364490 RepID=UPI00381A875B